MPLMKAATRADLPPELHALWDECERTNPTFRSSWSTMANSPTIFRHIRGELLELERTSPVTGRQFVKIEADVR